MSLETTQERTLEEILVHFAEARNNEDYDEMENMIAAAGLYSAGAAVELTREYEWVKANGHPEDLVDGYQENVQDL